MTLSIGARQFYISCELLWTVLSLQENLRSDDVEYNNDIGETFAKNWRTLYEQMTMWTLEAKHVPLDLEKYHLHDHEQVVGYVDTISDTLMFQWKKKITSAAEIANENYRLFKISTWQYYFYCQFLQHVLLEFRKLVADIPASVYYDYYQKDTALFSSLLELLEKERATHELQIINNKETLEKVFENLNDYPASWASEWREAVLDTVQEIGSFA